MEKLEITDEMVRRFREAWESACKANLTQTDAGIRDVLITTFCPSESEIVVTDVMRNAALAEYIKKPLIFNGVSIEGQINLVAIYRAMRKLEPKSYSHSGNERRRRFERRVWTSTDTHCFKCGKVMPSPRRRKDDQK